MLPNNFFDDAYKRVAATKNTLLKRYEAFLKGFDPFRRLVVYLHHGLNKVQYDPVNPLNRTSENPEGVQSDEEQVLAVHIERDKNLLDKVETYFRLRPVSTSILAFFVIATAATSAKNNPIKIVIAITIICAILPLLTSKQDDFTE